MNVAFGLKAHSGWAALVAVGQQGHDLVVTDRRRLELVEDNWAKQPYHAAEGLPSKRARELVARGVAQTSRISIQVMRDAVARERELGNQVKACAVLVGSPMPDWTVDEILAVHFRMHKAEGVLFRQVLLRAAEECGLKPLPIPEKELPVHAEKILARPPPTLLDTVATLGKAAGPPWGKDQKDAALAALIALRPRLG